ncbi:MAG: M1 family aminopeptidase [Bryobacteraceae bacterium]
MSLQAQSPTEGISHELARQRAARISDVKYRLSLDLVPDADRLPGREEISFQLAAANDPVVLDFRDGTFSNVSVNGAHAEAESRNGHIILPGRYFTTGSNTIALSFESGIATSGRAITRYRDSDDGAEYVYSLFVPMDASQAFPCFDQPDLKARFDLDITAPDNWTAVSNTRIEGAAPARPGFRHTDFAETRPLPTYLFAFAAGPFRMIPGEGFRLFVRQSKFDRASQEAPEVLRIARAGVRHMAEYFRQPYPFGKYDLILIPGFAFGGMEHAGATFLREESVLFRSVPTAGDKIQRAALILHETAHQWFGDLVTMRWFDDLWLKEGFAQYMAYETLATLYPPDEIWKRFYQSFKPAAYAIDATQGTTPIHQEIPNLKDAKSAYGAIVYSKTPGLLRQLSYVIGETAFRDGVRLFLQEHAYENAEWSDLIHAYERASGKPLQAWADAWIKQRGMPQVDVAWSCAEGRIDRFTLRQKDVLGEGHLWPIRTELLLAYNEGTPLTIPADLLDAEAPVPEAVGKPCPAWVLANNRDYAYGRFLLDERSLHALTKVGQALPPANPFERALIWGALWDAVREMQMSPSDYLHLAIRALPKETDEALTQSVLAHATTAFQRYLSDAQRSSLARELEDLLEQRTEDAPDLSLRILYYRAFRSVAVTPPALTHLKSLLVGKSTVPGLEIKPLDRWIMIEALLAHADPEAPALFHSEQERDSTGDGRKYAYVSGAAQPDAAIKKRYFDDYRENRTLSEDWVQQSLEAFNYWNQSALTLPYLEPALASLPQIKRDRKIFFVLAWLNAFIGGQQSESAAREVRQWLQAHPPEPDLARKVLEVLDELDRTVRIRARRGS